MKTIEVDPRVPGIRDEIPFPQAKQCSPELDVPSCQFSFPFSQKLQRLQEELIVTVEIYRHSGLPAIVSSFIQSSLDFLVRILLATAVCEANVPDPLSPLLSTETLINTRNTYIEHMADPIEESVDQTSQNVNKATGVPRLL